MASKKASLIPKNVKNPLFSAGLAHFPVEEFTQGVILVPPPKESEQLLTKGLGGEVDTFLGQNVTDLVLTQITGSEAEAARNQPPPGPSLLPPPPITSNFRAAPIRISGSRSNELTPPPVARSEGESGPDFKQIPLDDNVPLYNPSAVLKSITHQSNNELNRIVPSLDGVIPLYDPSRVSATLSAHSVKKPIPVTADVPPSPSGLGSAVLDPAFTSLSKHISTCSPSLVIDSGPSESTLLKQSADVSRKSSSSSSVHELTATLNNSQAPAFPYLSSSDSQSLTNNSKSSNFPPQSFYQSTSTPSFFTSATNFVGSLLSSDSSHGQLTTHSGVSLAHHSSAPSLANSAVPPLTFPPVNPGSLDALSSSSQSSVTSPPFLLYQPVPLNTTAPPLSDFSPSAPPESSSLPPFSSSLNPFPQDISGGAPPTSVFPSVPTQQSLPLSNQHLPQQTAPVPSNSSSQAEYSISSLFNQLNPFKVISPSSTIPESNLNPSTQTSTDSCLPFPSSLPASVPSSSLSLNAGPPSDLSVSPEHSAPPLPSKSPSSSTNPLPPPPLTGFQASSTPLSSLPNVHHTYLGNPYSIRKKPPPAFKPEHYFTPITEAEPSSEERTEISPINSDSAIDLVSTFPPLPQQSLDFVADQAPLVPQQQLFNSAVQSSPVRQQSFVTNQVPLVPIPSSGTDREDQPKIPLLPTEGVLLPSTSPVSKIQTLFSNPVPEPHLSGFQASSAPLQSASSAAANNLALPVAVPQQENYFKTESIPFSSDQGSHEVQDNSGQVIQESPGSALIQQKVLILCPNYTSEPTSSSPPRLSDSNPNLLQASVCSVGNQISSFYPDSPVKSQPLVQNSPILTPPLDHKQLPLAGAQSFFSPVNPLPSQISDIPVSSPPQVPFASIPPPPVTNQNQPPLGPPPPSTQPTSYRLSSFKKPSYAPVPDLDFTPRPAVMAYPPGPDGNVNQGVFHPPHIQTHSNSVESTSSIIGSSSAYQPFTAMAVNQTYRPVYHHWFYRMGDDQKNTWYPFSMADSLNLEQLFSSDMKTEGDSLVATDGGRYDVDVAARKRKAVYWHEAESEVRRCSWFVKGPVDSRYQPYDENIASLLEEEYKTACTKNEWNRRVELADGEVIIIHSPNTIAHHQRSSSPDPWGNPPPMQEKPRIVKRGLDEFEIPEGEPTQVDNLLLLVHGIGKVCDLRFRSLVEVVDDFRNISLSLVGSHYKTAVERGKAGRVEVLPVEWHRALHTDAIDQRLADITLPSIPKARQFTNETLLDILFYTSPVFCERIVQAVGNELNRVFSLYMERNPGFKGGVSLGGHSLGSLILFDMLCHQKPPQKPKLQSTPSFCSDETDEDVSSLGSIKTRARLSRRMSYLTIGSAGTGQPYIVYPQLRFQPKAFFALGSPIGMFVTVRGIESLGEEFRFPTCPSFYNIFHPNDPVAYRIEGLINPDMAHHPAVLIPHHKGRKRMHLELKETMAHVTAAVKQKLVESVRNTWNTVYSLARFNRIDPIVIENQVDKVIDDEILCKDDASTSSVGESVESEGVELKVGQLNGGRRIDHVLQEAPLETFNQYISAVRSHLVYWESEDTMLLILKEIYGAKGITADCQVPQPILPFELSAEANADPGAAYSHYTVSTTPPPSRQHTIAEEL